MARLTLEITAAILLAHRKAGWMAEKEVLFSNRRIDVLAIAPQGAEVIGYEVKTSLADFKNELRDPSKHRAVAQHCSRFYFVSPIDIIPSYLVPSKCGLFYFEKGDFYLVKGDGYQSIEHPLEASLLEQQWEYGRRATDYRNRLRESVAYRCAIFSHEPNARFPGDDDGFLEGMVEFFFPKRPLLTRFYPDRFEDDYAAR